MCRNFLSSYIWTAFHYSSNHVLFLFIPGWTVCSHALFIANNLAVSMGTLWFFKTLFLALSGVDLEIYIPGSYSNYAFSFLRDHWTILYNVCLHVCTFIISFQIRTVSPSLHSHQECTHVPASPILPNMRSVWFLVGSLWVEVRSPCVWFCISFLASDPEYLICLLLINISSMKKLTLCLVVMLWIDLPFAAEF